jgi:phenylpropionate dioxygenase-like ring-hydroxylating dioxygenase large terminal subunit
MNALTRNRFNTQIGQWQNDLDEGNYYQTWYPIHLASELKPGQLIGKEFLGTRVILYRDADGKPVVQSAYCPHVGADLACGALIDGQVRCAYHHWRFGADGRCTDIPTGDKIPAGARIYNYPAAEKWGLIWAFHGETPAFDVPEIPEVDEAEFVGITGERGERPIDHWLSTSNAFDFQHLRALHGLPAQAEPKEIEITSHSLEYGRGGNGPFRHHGKVTGTNTFAHCVNSPAGEHFMLVASAALAPGKSLSFYVVGVRKSTADKMTPRALHDHLAQLEANAMKLYTEDEPVLFSIRFRGPAEGNWIGADRHLASYFRYLREFPQARPFDT